MADFGQLDNGTIEAPKTEGKVKGLSAEQKAHLKQTLDSAMAATLTNDPTYKERVGRLQGAVAVVATLGFTDAGGMVTDESVGGKKYSEAKGKDVHAVTAAPKIVGYAIVNNGSEAIPYQTEKFTQDPATGKWVGTPVNLVLNPGETVCLSRKYLAMMASLPEFSMSFANGYVKVNKKPVLTGDVDAILSASHFVFTADEGEEKKGVYDDDVLKQIGVKMGDGTWTVAAEYEDTFGYLNNKEEKAPRAKRTPGVAGPNDKEKLSNYIQQLLAGAQG